MIARWVAGALLAASCVFLGCSDEDAAAPELLAQVAKYDTGMSWPKSIFVQGGHGYIVGDDNLLVIDVSNPAAPTEVARLAISNPDDVFVAGAHAFVAARSFDYTILDVSNPADPREIGPLGVSGQDIFVAGSYAYVAATPGLVVVDLSDVSNPQQVGSCDLGGAVDAVTVEGNHAVVIQGARLMAIDVSVPASPQLLGEASTADDARDVYGDNGFAYVADQSAGLTIIDVRDPGNPAAVGSLATIQKADVVHGSAGRVYVGTMDHVHVMDVSDPTAATELGHTFAHVENLFAQDAYVYVVVGFGFLEIYRCCGG